MAEENTTSVETRLTIPKYEQEAAERSLRFMDPKRWATMNIVAQTFMQSGALPSTIKNAPQMMMALQAGFEAGLQPIEALNSYYFVNGKLSMYGDIAISQVLRAGHDVEWGECNDRTATVTIKRGDNGKSLTSTFSMEMAKARGLTRNPVYVSYPENMLKYRAFGMTARFICPEALHGVPVKEELEGSAVIEAVTVAPGSEEKAEEAAKELNAPKPLEDALKAPMPEKPAKEKTPAWKKMKDAAEKAKAEMKEEGAAETPEDRAKRLIDEELGGRKLTEEETAFLRSHEAAAKA